MAELGVIASIVGIAGVGIKLSKTLYVTGERAVSADRDLRRLASNVSLFSATLKHFAQVMKSSQDLYSPEFEQTATQIVRECRQVFEELAKMAFMANQKTESGPGLGPSDSKKKFSLVQRVKVYFEQPKVEWLMAQLEYLKTTLSVMIQTLSLAAVTVKAKEDSETMTDMISEKIEQERMHVETLILARQLSVVVLQQHHYHASDANRIEQEEMGRVSPVPSEESVEGPSGPKLLTQDANPSTSMVKLGRGNLEFLDSAIPIQNQAVPSAIFTSHNEIIDQLLGRWTRLPEMEGDINERNRKEFDLESQAVEGPMDDARDSPSAAKDVTDRNATAPDLNLQLVDSLDSSKNSSTLVSSPITAPPQASYLNVHPMNGQPTSRTPPPPLATHTSFPLSHGPPSPSAATEQGLYRSISSPESATPTNSQMQTLSPQKSSFNAFPSYDSAQAQTNPYVPPHPLLDRSPISPAASPRTSVSNSGFYDQSNRPGSSPQPVARKFYAPPIDSPYGTSPDSDNDDDERNRRLGLGIPWRIRIGAKYWDFLDERLVGPRTPYLPTEPMSWLYSHDYAHTEIAEKWVCEEAVAERNYPYTHIQGDDGASSAWSGNQVWRILCPLKFKEIDALVERTIDIFRRRTTANPGPPPSSRGSDGTTRSHPVPVPVPSAQPYLPGASPQMPQQNPRQTLQDPNTRARADVFSTWQQMNNTQNQRGQQQAYQPQQRSVSFQDTSQPPPRPGNLRTDYGERSGRLSGEFVGGGSSVGAETRGVQWAPLGGNAQPSSVLGVAGSNASAGYAASSAQRSYREREKDRDRYARDRHDDDSDDYDRHRRKAKGSDRDKKKKKSSTAVTLAKVGGLMAMLDGLDAI